MISADFYPTTYDLTNPVRQLTNNIEYNPDATVTGIELSDAYWLGWMKWETVPDCWKFSTYTQTADTITIDFVTPSQNVNVGYLARRYTSAQSGRRWSNMYRRSGDSVSMYSVGYPNQYLNKYDIMGCAPIRQFWVQIFAACEYKTSSSATTYINSGIQLGSRYVNEYLSFFNGDSTLDFSLNVGSVGSVSISLDINNIEEDNTFIIEGTQGGYDYKIKAYFAFVCANTAPDVTAGGDYVTGVTATNIIPMIGVTIEDDYYLLCGDTSHFTQILGQIQIQVLANYVFNPNQMFNNMLVGGYKAEIDKNEFNSMAVNNTYFSGNTAFVKTASGNSGVLNRVLSPQEIMTIIGIMPRVGRGYDSTNIANYGYTENVIWATYVTEDNEFTATLITGDLSDDEFKAKLRPWQYDVDEWAENDYTEDDLPPYEPSGDEDEESGDRIPNQFRYFSGATNFITQYALTRTQLGQFGTKLWTSWADSLGDPTDMWKNFKIFIGGGDTGSIDIGTVLSFIVSLRVFPFDLSAYLGQTEPSIKIGTGNYPIEVANVWKLLSTVTYIDCGIVNVPRKFNDFRDYTNVTVSCYFPYCGTVQLNAGDVVGKTLHAWYAVDLQSGECLAVLESYDDTGMLYNVASISGSMGALIPITATNSGQIMAQRISDAANVAGFFVGNVTRGADVANRLGSKRGQSAMLGAIGEAISGQIDDIGKLANQGMSMLSRSAIECPSMSGGSGLAAFMTPDSPYIQIRYGIYSEPANYPHSVGRISTSSGTIGSYKGSGFITCENVDTTKLTCHNDEKAAIAAALETGVFV